MRIVRKILLTLVALPVLAALAGVALAPTVLHPFHRKLTAEQIGQCDEVFARVGATREEFTVYAPDGVVLRGWKVRTHAPLETKGAAPTTGKSTGGSWVLLLHGRSRNRFVMLPHAEFLLVAGYNVVMMDARVHGESGGTLATYGYLEKRDETAIINALELSENVKHLFALGESMGAAVSLQAAAADPRIEAVVAEGAFRNLREATYDYAGLQQSEWLGKTLFRPAAEVSRWIVEKRYGFRLENVSPENAVAERAFPVLLICGLSDRKIPCRHSEAIFRAATRRELGNSGFAQPDPAPQLWHASDTGHEKAIKTHMQEFQQRVLKFFAEAEKMQKERRPTMLSNRSVPPCTVIPVLYYPDPSEAAEWLCKAFGFKVRLRIGKNHRIQMKAGDGCLVVAEATAPAQGAVSPEAKVAGGHVVMVRVEDAKAHCERARQFGARILTEPQDHVYGERQYNAEDPFGHRWDFTQTIVDVDPKEWGGEAVNLQ